jgi:lipocalin-like protein
MVRWLVALFWIALTVGPAVADDGANLIGTWRLSGGEVEFQDSGERRPLYGADRVGYIIFTREGRMFGIIEGDGRKAPQTDEDRARLFRTMFAYSGPYRLEGDKWITAVDVAWNPAWTGTDQVRFYKLDGDRLVVSTPWGPSPVLPGKTTRVTLTWTRVR